MSARTEPEAASCRFCGGNFTAAGVKNHERYCDENPNSGVHPDDAPNMFDADGPESQQESSGEVQAVDADPDQRVANEGANLPERETLVEENKGSGGGTKENDVIECSNCGSTNVVPSYEAREEAKARLETMPGKLERIFDATESYCNNCFAVFGGELDAPHVLGGGRP